MEKYLSGKVAMYIRRIDYFIVSLVIAVLITILGLVAIDLIMLIVANSLNMSEYTWLVSLIYIVMNIIGITFLSKFIVTRFSPLNPIVHL